MFDSAADQEFHVDWGDPADAELTWVWDAAHFPNPMTPLSEDLWKRAHHCRLLSHISSTS